MHSGKRKGEDLNGSTLTPSSKQRRTATETAVTAMDVMTSPPTAKKDPPTAKKDPPAKKAPECAMFVNEWEAFTKKHSAMAICFKPEFWDFMEKKGLKGQGLAALLTVPSQWLHEYILDNERKKLSQKALDGLLLLVAKEKKDLVLFWLDFCKDICNGKEECTLLPPKQWLAVEGNLGELTWALREAARLKFVDARFENVKWAALKALYYEDVQDGEDVEKLTYDELYTHVLASRVILEDVGVLENCLRFYQKNQVATIEFKIADMIFLFRELMEVDEDFADIVSLFKKNGWYYFTEDADGANGSSMPALKRSASMDSNGSMKIYVAKPKPRGVRVKDDILGFAWALPSGYHSHWIMAERWPIGSKRRDNMEKEHPVQVYGSKFDGTAEYICFATKRVICENDNIKDKEKLITDDLYTIPYMALKKDFLEHMELAKEDWTAEKQRSKSVVISNENKPPTVNDDDNESQYVDASYYDALKDGSSSTTTTNAKVDLSGNPMVYDRPIRFCDDCVKKDHPAGAYDKKGLHTCHLCPKGAEWYETDYVVNDYNRGGTTLYHGYKCRECGNKCVMKDFNQVSYMYNPSPGWVYTNVWSSGFQCPECRDEGDSLGPEQENFEF